MLAEYEYDQLEANKNEVLENAETDTLKQYLKEIGKYELLNNADQEALFRRIRKGDREAHNIVVEHNLRLVVKYAKSIKRAYRVEESIMDLVQAGNIGLMRAVDKFEFDKGYAFSTYASWWIKQSIIRHIYDNESAIRVPVHLSERFVAISKAIRIFREETGREPTYEELSKHVKISPKDYELFKSVDRNITSLNVAVGDDGDCELMDFVSSGTSADPVYDETQHKMLGETINDVLDKLDERERYIIKARYGLDGHITKTLEEIGADLGITRERVRQIETVAMKKLRTSVKASSIRAFR